MKQVKNITLKLLVICFMVGFGLFFGMDIAHKRLSSSTTATTQNITPKPKATAIPSKDKVEESASLGPMTAATARRQAQSEQLKEQAVQDDQPSIVLKDSFVNRLTNAIGDFFRHLASFLLHAVVAFFKFILG
ncbi:hypothetical protein EHS13_12805 [Paenibacillus psychroresistens]|uniref:Uncharacterized protein n=1 Tax=Paenibacillus psychroresistens TaxID=1778678 RepID=A0A6B8RHZ7_9BACL|nr:hypothetical protein [Paenibacillus psychroresistens]QGQ95699.1 hypothetical protein EHS13_12805 [Paenibacillus psychroresistens]